MIRSDPADIGGLQACLDEAVATSIFPGAALWLAQGSKIDSRLFAGRLTYEPQAAAVGPATCFDLASLTKPIVTVTLAMLAVANGKARLSQTLGERLPQFAHGPWRAVTLHHLLQHASGLPDWRPLFRLTSAWCPGAPPGSAAFRTAFQQAICKEPFEAQPGVRSHYSDLGYMVLGWYLEQIFAAPLHLAARQWIFVPLGLGTDEIGFRPTSSWDADQAGPHECSGLPPTEDCLWRGASVRGVVHDENAHALGGVAGHAGLFATLDAVATWAYALLEAARGASAWLPAAVVRAFWQSSPLSPATWHLGFDGPSPGRSSGGCLLSAEAVGHLGFTGCSVWLDPLADRAIVLLTNRVHPRRDNVSIKAFRPGLHDLAIRWLAAQT